MNRFEYVIMAFYLFNTHCKTFSCSSFPVSGDHPTLPELIKIDIPLRVRDKYDSFGICLLNDETGDQMAIIKDDCRGNPEKITIVILREWLKGRGMEVSWKSLIETLRSCKINSLADQIEMATENKV